jgi:hypothetical protein
MKINNVEYHLEFYIDDSTQIAQYENMAGPIIPPRIGDQVHFHNHGVTLKITRVIHEFVGRFADEPPRFTLSHIIKAYGSKTS